MKKKSTHKQTPKRPQRLLLAKQWLAVYGGKNKVRGYAKHFRVDLLCAIKELRLLDVEVSIAYENGIKTTVAAMEKKQLKSERQKNEQDGEPVHDDVFAYIAGYTSGGAPYGLTWEEMGQDGISSDAPPS
ncbi:hypothetical protein [Mucilaginibacter paludis]|uniref:Uncharacterized protein n=1 Tax=Mucilaginibacter paludis DSM 18603 TaxID=714943 RepID=H1YJ01_9SPHI|nr:hypothetical protein [Mucilaginibacter paludis]EHQ27696.1 hypothetical protein Mucpa_3598 [Mucilaginibacter paludis DSM 18603]